MSISAKIIADSISEHGIRITTFELRYPRFIHAELMTHRVFSRNSASSRAIPIPKMLRDIIRDMAMPIHWGAHQPGMQANEQLKGVRKWLAQKVWKIAGYTAVAFSYLMYKLGAHKQIANRITEPFSHITVCVTSTEWANWYALRDHKDAQPEIKQLASLMKIEHALSVPNLLLAGEWHLPYANGSKDPKDIPLSMSRCASVSYKTVDGKEMTEERARELHKKLLEGDPLHASPAEHQATPDQYADDLFRRWENEHLHGNFIGWIQYRKTLKNEYIRDR